MTLDPEAKVRAWGTPYHICSVNALALIHRSPHLDKAPAFP